MRIVLTGVSTSNKGAELMLYAILREIECRFHEADVVLDMECLGSHPLSYVQTSLHLSYKPHYFLMRVVRKLGLNDLVHKLMVAPIKNADYFIDCSGFYFSDQMDLSDTEVSDWTYQLTYYKKHQVKSILLPQAFGPVQKKNTRYIVKMISDNVDKIYAREKVSFDYLKEAGIDMSKVKIYTDFTCLVHGRIPMLYNHLKGAVCIIPNNRMIQQKISTTERYIKLLTTIIKQAELLGKKVYFLIHAEGNDLLLARKCKKELGNDIEIVEGLNALEVKGMISTSYLCISSRFHGVASSLNSCVPCLATSWSHKYQELFNDFKQYDCVLPLDDNIKLKAKIDEYLNLQNNRNIRDNLVIQAETVRNQTEALWRDVWSD